jgi:MerR family Zn(II)-responsive transcriptional regulator of zntA
MKSIALRTLTVSEFSRRVDVAPHLVRYYTKIGLLHPARTPGNGYKVFQQADISRFHFIRQAQSIGCTLEEIREILAPSQQSEPDCHRVRDILHDRLVKNQQRLLELSQLQQRIQKALAFCELAPANFSNEDLLRHLIEFVGKTPVNPV